MARSNLFSKLIATALALAAVLVSAPRAHAIHLHALYTASCQREIGIILDVGPRRLHLLNLDGKIVDVERFEVIYYASFSLDLVPMARVSNPEKVPFVEVKTYQDGGLQTLVRGWPVDFNKDKINFLTLRGSELVIDRTSVWSIDYQNQKNDVEFSARPFSATEFIHPYVFANCPTVNTGGPRATRAYPQTLLSDPVAIKREFDRLAQGHEEIRRYVSAQQFYPRPEVYKNATSLGLWLSTPSRYGASKTRENNFTPYLVNEFSSGPFGFQSIFTSGSGPIPQSVHEETQTQVYYRMKADYFHFSAMVDPSLLLVGSKYKWAPNDLTSTDMRAVESAFAELGFDYDRFALELYVGGSVETAGRFGDLFARNNLSLPRLGLRYQGYTWTANLIAGAGSREGFKATLFRANFDWQPSTYQRFLISFIKRDLDFSGEDQADSSTHLAFTSSHKSMTGAVYGFWRVHTRYWVGGFVAVEKVDLTGAQGAKSDSKSLMVPKAGALVSLTF